MSDERYTVLLGDRRYAIHRKWAKPARPFGFLSDLMVDRAGCVHVAQRGTDRPVVVFGLLLHADLEIDGAEGEGQAGKREEQHRLVARAGGEAAVQHKPVGVGHGAILPRGRFPA